MKIKAFLVVSSLLFLCSSFVFCPFLSAQAEPKPDPLCGPNSLLVVCQKLGVKTNLDELKRLSDYDEVKGTTMAGLYKASRAKRLNAVGMKISLDELAKLKKIPVIAYLWDNHCLVIDGFEGDNLRIIDPPKEPLLVSKKEFVNGYSGFSLLISKGKISLPKMETKRPDIRFDEYFFNFGVLHQWEKKEETHLFKFKNSGNEDLVISQVRACCGANATLLSEKSIAPGGEGEIKATVDVGGRRGEQDYSVYVYSNDPVIPVVKLQVKGIIQRGLPVSPGNIYLGSVKKGTLTTRKIYITKPEDEELNILKIESSSKYISTEISPIKEKDYEGFEVEVALMPYIPLGKFNEKITVYTTSDKSPTIEIPVTGNIKGDIEFHPDMFFFGAVHPVRSSVSNGVKRGETPTSKITVFTTGKEPLKIEKIENILQFVSVTITPKTEGKEYELTASLKDNAPTGTIKGTITIHTNNPTQPTIEIPVYGLVRE